MPAVVYTCYVTRDREREKEKEKEGKRDLRPTQDRQWIVSLSRLFLHALLSRSTTLPRLQRSLLYPPNGFAWSMAIHTASVIPDANIHHHDLTTRRRRRRRRRRSSRSFHRRLENFCLVSASDTHLLQTITRVRL